MKAIEIYLKMHSLKEESREYLKAMEVLYDECGAASKPYITMKGFYDEKLKEAIEFENTEFKEV